MERHDFVVVVDCAGLAISDLWRDVVIGWSTKAWLRRGKVRQPKRAVRIILMVKIHRLVEKMRPK
jgi:hypothetical protein